MRPISYKDWKMIFIIPLSKSGKAKALLEKYQDRSNRCMVDEFGNIIAYEYIFNIDEFPAALRDYYNISNLKNTDYNIISDKLKYDKFSEGHHCFFLKYENPTTNENLCNNFTYGRKSLVGCSRIPIYEATEEYASHYATQMLFDRKEIFWYQAGYVKNLRWYIDKDFLLKIVYHVSNTLSYCPLFDIEYAIKIINELPDYIVMENNKYFEFIPIDNKKIRNHKEIGNNSLILFDSVKSKNQVTHIVKRKLPKYVMGIDISFQTYDYDTYKKTGAFLNVDLKKKDHYEFDGEIISKEDYNVNDYLKY